MTVRMLHGDGRHAPGPHVLVVRLDNDGDVLLTGPAIRAAAASAARVTLLCGPRGAGAASMLPGVDEVVVWRCPWIDPQPHPVDTADTAKLVERLSELSIDVAMIHTSFHQSALPTALLLRLAGIQRIGGTSEDYPGSLLDVRESVMPVRHEVTRGLQLAERLGFRVPPGDTSELRVDCREDAPPAAPPPPYLVIHPGASVPARTWPPTRWAECAACLAAEGWRIAVTGSGSEAALTAAVAESAGGAAVDLGGRTSPHQLAATLRGASVVVCGNTGPAHLAAAVGTPVVSVFAPTVEWERWRPWQVPSICLGDQSISCSGCRADVCPVPGHPCILSVSVEHAHAAVRRLTGARLQQVVA